MPELPVSHFLLVILYKLRPSWYQRTQQGGQAAPWVRRTGRWWNWRVPNLEANTAQFLLLPRERVCKSVIRDGRRPRGMGGPPKAVIWMPTYLAPALQGAACECFRGRASCGLWFRELTQIVSEPFFMGLQRSALSRELEPVVLGVILSCLAGSRLCSEQAAMAGWQKGGFSILHSLCC